MRFFMTSKIISLNYYTLISVNYLCESLIFIAYTGRRRPKIWTSEYAPATGRRRLDKNSLNWDQRRLMMAYVIIYK